MIVYGPPIMLLVEPIIVVLELFMFKVTSTLDRIPLTYMCLFKTSNRLRSTYLNAFLGLLWCASASCGVIHWPLCNPHVRTSSCSHPWDILYMRKALGLVHYPIHHVRDFVSQYLTRIGCVVKTCPYRFVVDSFLPQLWYLVSHTPFAVQRV